MSSERNTIQADVIVVRVHDEKELDRVTWEVNLDGEVHTFTNRGSLLVTMADEMAAPELRRLEALHGCKLRLWDVAEKAVELAKLPKSQYRRAKRRPDRPPAPRRRLPRGRARAAPRDRVGHLRPGGQRAEPRAELLAAAGLHSAGQLRFASQAERGIVSPCSAPPTRTLSTR